MKIIILINYKYIKLPSHVPFSSFLKVPSLHLMQSFGPVHNSQLGEQANYNHHYHYYFFFKSIKNKT